MQGDALVLAITGASGSRYGVRTLELFLRAGRRVHLVISPSAGEVFERELDRRVLLEPKHFDPKALLGPCASELDLSLLTYHDVRNFQAGIASGSFLTAGMAVVPCSLGTVAAIAHGTSQNLIHRAADVHLKERRKLVLVPRETPLGVIQLKNLLSVAEAGAVVLPAMPAFYTLPESVQDMIDFIVGRVCDQLGVPHQLLKRWGTAGGGGEAGHIKV
jgi:4-hydroxy-3-polyprenylbenzoate decarboxylase